MSKIGLSEYDSFIAFATWLPPEAKALYLFCRAYPSTHLPVKAVLAKELGLGRDRTTKAVKALVELGLIAHSRRHNLAGRIIGTDLFFIPQDRHTAFQYSGRRRLK